MSWQCRLIEWEDRDQVRDGKDGQLPVGTMWYLREMLSDQNESRQFYLDHVLSIEYKRDWLGKRPPLCVALPGGHWFNVDSQASDSGETHGWTITGEPPNVTANPSINAVGDYHGWLRDGVLSDDVEGRTYPAQEETCNAHP